MERLLKSRTTRRVAALSVAALSSAIVAILVLSGFPLVTAASFGTGANYVGFYNVSSTGVDTAQSYPAAANYSLPSPTIVISSITNISGGSTAVLSVINLTANGTACQYLGELYNTTLDDVLVFLSRCPVATNSYALTGFVYYLSAPSSSEPYDLAELFHGNFSGTLSNHLSELGAGLASRSSADNSSSNHTIKGFSTAEHVISTAFTTLQGLLPSYLASSEVTGSFVVLRSYHVTNTGVGDPSAFSMESSVRPAESGCHPAYAVGNTGDGSGGGIDYGPYTVIVCDGEVVASIAEGIVAAALAASCPFTDGLTCALLGVAAFLLGVYAAAKGVQCITETKNFNPP
jgi:hypothetical protein